MSIIRFTQDHVWFNFSQGFGGITSYLPFYEQRPISFFPICKPGSFVKGNEPIGKICSGDIYFIYSPLSAKLRWISRPIQISNFNSPLFGLEKYEFSKDMMSYDDYMSYILTLKSS